MSVDRVLVLEFNEICPSLIDELIARGQLPNFKALKDRSEAHVSHTTEAKLEPWIQWVTLHTGVPFDVHGIENLDEAEQIRQPLVWDRLAETGRSALVFGAMNGRTRHPDRVVHVPDPWAGGLRPSRREFDGFYDFVKSNVVGHTGGGRKAAAGFLRFWATHGAGVGTAAATARQLAAERLSRRDVKWKRAAILDMFSWDVFAHYYKKIGPDFAIFFANSTAFYQHRYWRHMDPDAYKVKPSAEDLATYGGAIPYGYRCMDRLVGRAMRLVGPRTAVVLCSALSQQPNLRYEEIGGRYAWRPKDFVGLMRFCGVEDAFTVEPVMTHQAWATFADAAKAKAALEKLNALTRDGGEPVMEGWVDGTRAFFYCKIMQRIDAGVTVTAGAGGRSATFGELFYPLGGVNNARHHPDGVFWVAAPGVAPAVPREKLPLTEAHDRLLSLLLPTPRPAAAPAESTAA